MLYRPLIDGGAVPVASAITTTMELLDIAPLLYLEAVVYPFMPYHFKY